MNSSGAWDAKAKKYMRLRYIGWLILVLAAVTWAVNNVQQTNQVSDLIDKNDRLVRIVAELEDENQELNTRLNCRSAILDARDQAIGRGLVAVASDDPAELERQAQIILDVVNQLEECE